MVQKEQCDTNEDKEIKYNVCDRIANWWRLQKLNDVHFVTLEIKNENARQKFNQQELMAVKNRWEACTLLLLGFIFISIIVQWNEKQKLLDLLFAIIDITLVFFLMALLGRFWKNVHHFSLLMLVLARATYMMLQIVLLSEGNQFVAEMFNYYGWSTAMFVQVIVPASLLFLTQFRLYLYTIMPFSIVLHTIMVSYTEQVYASQDNTCEQIVLNSFDIGSTMWKDFFLICFISAGIFSNKASSVNRFITNEKTHNQQVQLTKILN